MRYSQFNIRFVLSVSYQVQVEPKIDLGCSAVEVFLRPAVVTLESFAKLLEHDGIQGRIGVS